MKTTGFIHFQRWAVVLFPLLVMAGWVASVEWGLQTGIQVELPIEGYDPRDLLSGHYLTYAVNFGSVKACDAGRDVGQERCVCLEKSPSGTLWAATGSVACERLSSDSCPVFIKGTCTYGRFQAGIERFYIPEKLSGQLAVVPPAATIRVRLNKNGVGLVEAFLIGGRPFQEALKH